MTGCELLSLTASIASLILAIIAIWLSLVFYRMSSQLSESTKEASKGIGSSVERLEELFDKLYADTFSMMKDTVSDMRKHIWPDEARPEERIDEEADKKAEQKIRSLTDEVQRQLSEVLKRQELTDDRVTTVTHELGSLVEKAISQSRKVEVEARDETIREHILRAIHLHRHRKRAVTAGDIVDRLKDDVFPIRRVVDELRRMKTEEVISYEGEVLGASTEISLK